MMTDYAYLQVAGYYIYDITPVDGGTRYTYCKTNPPPYGPNNPSFEICDKLIIVGGNDELVTN
jgi:hypothetical protein